MVPRYPWILVCFAATVRARSGEEKRRHAPFASSLGRRHLFGAVRPRVMSVHRLVRRRVGIRREAARAAERVGMGGSDISGNIFDFSAASSP
jgi:hypothetical protein